MHGLAWWSLTIRSGGSQRGKPPRRRAVPGLEALEPRLALSALFQETSLFEQGDQGYDTFRIPALAVTKSGTLLAVVEGRKASSRDSGDIDLVLRRSTDQGATWSPLEVVFEEGGDAPITIGNPCL